MSGGPATLCDECGGVFDVDDLTRVAIASPFGETLGRKCDGCLAKAPAPKPSLRARLAAARKRRARAREEAMVAMHGQSFRSR